MIRDFVRRSTVGLLLLPPLLHSAWGATCPADVDAAFNENRGFYNAPFYPAWGNFVALKEDGSITSWGNSSYAGENAPTGSGYVTVTPNGNAYAALKTDGSISAWGDSGSGGEGEPSDKGYISISSTSSAFAALKSDGGISSWGSSGYGGNGAPSDKGYVSITSTYFAFAALKADGSISSWGHTSFGGSEAPSDNGYVSISSNAFTFVARKADGSLVSWGDNNYYYGSGASDAPDGNGYVSISSSEGAFAALKADGSISAWGVSSNGAEGAPSDTGHVALSSNFQAFAALTADGSINAWGQASYGGNGAPTDNGYVSIKSNAYAFASLKDDGSISAWGNMSGGGEGEPTDSGYISISATNYAFAALKADGSITVWGDSNNGGDGGPVDKGYVLISSSQNAFAAMKADGSISAWGSSYSGQDSAPTDIGYVSINNRALTGNSDCSVSPSITLSGSPESNVVAGNAYSFIPEVDNTALVISQNFSILNAPSWASFDTTTGVLTGTPALTDVGTFSDITISVSNGFSSGQLPAFSITVVEPNATPTINTALADINTDEDASFSYPVPADTFADADVDDTLVLSTSSLPDWLSFDNMSNTFSGTPEQGDIGAYSITIRATDTIGAFVEDTMIITVDNVNDAPTVATAVTDLRMDQGGTLSFEVPSNTFTDVDTGEVLTLSAIDLPTWLSFDESTATFSGTPGNAQVGTLTVTLRATDSSGLQVEDSFEIEVGNVNDAPTLVNVVADQRTNEDAPFSLQIPDNTFADIDAGDVLTLSAGGLPSWLSFNDNSNILSGTPVQADVGALSITLRATDIVGAFVEQDLIIRVINVNDAPTVANPIADQSTNEDASFTYTVPANTYADMDSDDALTLTASSLPDWLSFDGDTRVLSGTPEQADVGAQTIKVRATDIAGAFVEESFTITVVNVNDAPTVALAVNDQNIEQGDTFNFDVPDGTFADVDTGESLTLSAVDLPEWLSFDPETGTFSGSPSNEQVGTLTVTLQATDSSGALVQHRFEITIDNINDAPTVANALADHRTNEDAPFSYTVPANAFADVDTNDTLTLSASDLPAWLNFDGDTGILSGTPAQANVGTQTAKVRATDISGAFVEAALRITVVNTNDAPTIDNVVAGLQTNEDSLLSVEIPDNTFADVDAGDALTLSVAGLPDWLSFDENSNTLSGTPAQADVGGQSITLRATDIAGAFVEQDLIIRVVNVNDAPTIANPLDDQRTNEDAPFSYTVPADTFGDVDTGDILTLSASDLPEWLSFDGETGMLSGTPVQADVGAQTMKIRVTDIAGASAEEAMIITVVNTNDAPTLASAVPNMLTNEDDLFSLEIPENTFTDVDAGDELILSVIGLPDWLSFDTNSNSLSGTPTQIDVGAHTITLRATDIAEAFVEQALTITVININDTPTLAIAVPSQTIEQDGAFSLEVPDGTFVDADTGESLILSAIDLPDWLGFDPETGTFSGTPGNEQVGTVTVTLQATDSSGALVQHSFDITVGNVNDAPILTAALTDQVVEENTAFNYTLPSNTFIDPDVGDSLTLSATDLPAWLSFDPGSAIFSGTPAQADVGTTTITVQASDVDGLTAQASFELVVNDINNMAPEFSSSDSLEVAENSSGVIHQIVMTDVDTDDIIGLTISGDDAAQFQFDAATGEMSLSQGLDHEAPTDANADGVYQLSVRAEDLAGNNASQDIFVTVVDVNEAPVLTVQTLQIDEFAEVDTLLGTLTAHDPEEGSLRWSLLDEDSPFVLNESGELSLAAALDFETIAAYELNVQVDDGLFSTSGIAQVQVTDATAEQATIWLQLEQDGHQVQQIRADGGPVSVTAVVGNPIPGLATGHDWAQSSQAVLDRSISIDSEDETLEFSSSGLSSGDELVAHVVVTRDGVDSEDTLTMRVVASSTTFEQTVDSDGDGILDIYEGDLDATADATTANKLQTVRGDDLSHVMESEEGTFLRLGSVARAALSDQSRIEIEDLMASLSAEAVDVVTDTLPDGDVENIEELFDFEVANLAAVGDSVRVILPLQTALTAGAQYMKFHPVRGWRSFEIDDANGISSAPALAGIEGQCLPPGSEGWSEGLTEGHLCIELRIEDGGMNDADSYDELGNRPAGLGLNGNVKDPGAVINSASEPEIPPIGPATPDTDNPPVTPAGEDTDTDGVIKVATRGSGHTGLWLLAVLIGFLGVRIGLRRRDGSSGGVELAGHRWVRRSAGFGFLALLLSGGTQASDPQSAYLVLGSGISSLEPDVSDSSVELADDSSQAYWWAMGYRFNSRWQGEVEYMDLGSAGLRPGGALSYTDVNVSALFDVWRTTLFGSRSDLSLFARFGVGRLDARSGTGQRVEKQSHAQFIIGGGLEFSLTNHILLRAEVTSYDEDASRFGLSAVLLLGP